MTPMMVLGMAMAMTMMIVMMVMRMMTRTTTIARLTSMMVATVMMNLFRRNNRERVDRVRVDITYWHIAGSVA